MSLAWALVGWAFLVGVFLFALALDARRTRRVPRVPDAPVRVTFVTWDAGPDLPYPTHQQERHHP